MKQHYEKVIITDDPATWPSDGECLYSGNPIELKAAFSQQYVRFFLHKYYWWLKPVDHVWTDEDIEKAFEAGNKRGWSGYPDTDNWTQPTKEQYLAKIKEEKQ